ncbi:hypothetical protein [Reichenbachiella sp.]|uniref:hypothetical protein n=1 Tax=Reichenbachiella sp. TaxID=2184521 RepID=UPI003B5C9D7B
MQAATAKHPRYVNRIARRKKRNDKIRSMFNRLYHEERKRIDDVEEEVSEFWGLAVDTIRKIMRERD